MANLELGLYQHYKGKLYEVIGVAKHSETLEDMVLYKALYQGDFPAGQLWVRPKNMFLEEVEIDGEKVARFEFKGLRKL